MVSLSYVPYAGLMAEVTALSRRLGARLRAIRKDRAAAGGRPGTQERFSELTGLTQQRISRLERGESWDAICDLVVALRAVGADPADLFSEGPVADPVTVEVRELLPQVSPRARRIALEVLRGFLQDQQEASTRTA